MKFSSTSKFVIGGALLIPLAGWVVDRSADWAFDRFLDWLLGDDPVLAPDMLAAVALAAASLAALLGVFLVWSALQEFRQKYRGRRAAATADSVERPEVPIDMQQAFRYLADQKDRWVQSDVVTRNLAIFEDLRQAARDGKLVIRGRPEWAKVNIESFRKPHEPISADTWRDSGFDAIPYIFVDDDNGRAAREAMTAPDSQAGDPQRYADLLVDLRDLERLWPVGG